MWAELEVRYMGYSAATVFHVPIYFISPSTTELKWNVIHSLNNESIHFPDFPDVEVDKNSFVWPKHYHAMNYHFELSLWCSGSTG